MRFRAQAGRLRGNQAGRYGRRPYVSTGLPSHRTIALELRIILNLVVVIDVSYAQACV